MKKLHSSELLLIRHAETILNTAGKFQGHLDSELSEKGKLQAEALASRLAKLQISALYSSDLGRTLKTAFPISRVIGLEIRKDERLRERDVGIFQGFSLLEIQEKFPEEYQNLVLRDSNYIIPQGESMEQVKARTLEICEEIAHEHENERVILVTHGGPISSLLRHTLDVSYTKVLRYSNHNTGVNIFSCNAGEWRLETWGDISHLENRNL